VSSATIALYTPKAPAEEIEFNDGRRVLLQCDEGVIVAYSSDGSRVARGRCRRLDSDHARATLTVLPAWRGLGLGRHLFHLLLDRAAVDGIRYVTFLHSTDNLASSHLLTDSSYIVARRTWGGTVRSVIILNR
jgi:GNAT superfamily N-acetyltransferase